jgi:hypothetical protein
MQTIYEEGKAFYVDSDLPDSPITGKLSVEADSDPF